MDPSRSPVLTMRSEGITQDQQAKQGATAQRGVYALNKNRTHLNLDFGSFERSFELFRLVFRIGIFLCIDMHEYYRLRVASLRVPSLRVAILVVGDAVGGAVAYLLKGEGGRGA